jgi:PAS domain S-box-containing protein
MAAGFMVMGGVLIAVVSTALRRLEGSLSRARRAEEAVREADERLRLALDAASVGTWSMDAETGVVDWARNVDRVLGLPRPALPRSREEALAWVHPDDRAAAVAAVAEVSAGRAPEYRTEQRLVAPDGRVTWVETRARIRVAGRSGKRWLTGTLVDVTARKVVEQRRQEAQAVLLALAGSEAVRRADRRAALRELTEAGTRLLDVGRCGIWLLEDGGRALRCLDLFQRGRARHDEGTTIAVGAYPAYFAALAAERVIAADDARADPRTRQMETDYLAAFGITAMLDAPVFLEGRMAGVICHEHVGDEPRVWSADEQTLAGSLADCVARALEALARAEGRARLERAYAELGVLSRRMESAKEEERRRIARELHDELGQTVTAMKINLQLAAGDAAAGDGRWTADMLALADRTIQVVRQLTHTLRPPLLDELGLVPALRAFLEEQERRSTVRCGLEAPDSVAPLPPEIEIAVFRVVQESVTNALRHARARAVQVAVRRTDGRIEIEARDDGAGFDVESVVGRALDGSSLGLVGMRERVRTLGGTFAVSSRPGAGTQITVSLPV